MNSSYDRNGLQFGWDATSLEDGEKCARYYQLSHLDNWNPVKKNVHLLFGGWYATSQEHYHKLIALGKNRDEALREVVREALISTWIDGAPWVSAHNTKTRENLIRTIIWYAEHFKDSEILPIQLEHGPAVELSFSIPIDDDLIYCGHFDSIVEYAGDNYVMDQKTSQNTISPAYMAQFDMSVQMSGYTFAGKAVFNIPVKGVIIDAAQIAVGFSAFTRGFSFRTEEQLDEWYAQSLYHIHDLRRLTERYRQDGIELPMRRASCNNYGGCRFRDICNKPPGARLQFLKADFTQDQKPWDPLKRR